MAKKRKVSRKVEPTSAREVDAKDARLTIKTYEDVADSEDEYWADQDRIDFDDDDDEPRSKRIKRQDKEDAFLEISDEEILGEEESDEDDEEEEDGAPSKPVTGKKASAREEDASDEEERREEEEGDEGWWGSSKREYYDADNIETEADALEEEAEARRLQAKKLAKMDEADFAFDENEWLASNEQPREEENVVTEVLKEVEVTEDMGPEERYKLLQARYPEFDYLVDEFREAQTLLPVLQKEAEGKPNKSLEVTKSWLIGCYVAALASYFAILTSPSRDTDGSVATLNPSELRDHEVMETLMECREAWLRAKDLKLTKPSTVETGMLSPPDEDDLVMPDVDPIPKRKSDKLSKSELRAKKTKAAEAARKAKVVEQSLADLSTLLKSTKKSAKAAAIPTSSADGVNDDDKSDFGEEDALDARTAADKARRKKTLKFYTSQIVQKANKRAGAGRDAGGDMDIPYRERFRDRQARLNAEAERRGKKDSKFGANLGEDESDGDDAAVARQVRGEEDEYYDMVAHGAQRKRADKTARNEALAQARKDGRVVEQTQVGADGKRQITYQIQKNKGLTPHRKKEVRNPRVKKRMKFEEKQKKLRSVKAVYKGGEGPGGYQGELSGIKTGLVKSVKL
ncbi:Sas10 C-terminal domain-containing protein [Chaetomium sp. MPI-SDFR-AT-0129]|nr:Sas10 C-terminal domain-containing protein [Chaetomium sp. MPI-SDFR-AT-0129]